MSRALLAFAVLFACACSAPTTCPVQTESLPAANVISDPLSGSALLSTLGEQSELVADVTLAGLPELWPADSALKDAGVSVSVTLAYLTAPVGGDGNTQMPRVQVSLDQQPGTVTSSFPSTPEGTSSRLFDDCNLLGAQYCCAFGSQECRARLHVTIQRLDGAPFPPVQVQWTARAGVFVQSCPRALETPSLSVTSEAP